MFILAATNDQLGLASHSIDLYNDWTKAKKPAELHMFNKGGHGFGMKKQNIPTDHWIERFADWLDGQGLLKGNNNDLGSLQGTWHMLNPDGSGTTIPDSLRECKGDITTVSFGGQLMMKAKYSLDPTKTPKAIDYDVLEGNNQGKKLLGIYESDGDTVKFCFAFPGKDRPTDFSSGEGRIASTWKRESGK